MTNKNNYKNPSRNISHCKICGSRKRLIQSVKPYISCTVCRHEYLRGNTSTNFIINESLNFEEIKKSMPFDRFKDNVLQDSMKDKDNFLIIDIGSGSGKFLYHNKHRFKHHMGVEVTKECVLFSKKLGLNIETGIDKQKIKKNISVVTFWHSLEHIPLPEIEKIFQIIKDRSDKNTRIIISVPNSNSLMYKIFKQRWAFFDSPNHLHQFSTKSLNTALEKYNFFPEKNFYSFSYTIFGYVQSFVNYFNSINNFLYYYKKRGVTFSLNKFQLTFLTLYNYLLSIIFLLPSLILSFFDFFSRKRRGIITICYAKK